MTKTYSEKLRDPRWQKKRLEILERDQFTCMKCTDTSRTLHVHHLYYENDYRDPWDYPNNALMTLCESCHEEETAWGKKADTRLLKALKSRGFLCASIDRIAQAFESMDMPQGSEDMRADILFNILWDDKVIKKAEDHYFGRPKKKKASNA